MTQRLSYRELSQLSSFEERFDYLNLSGKVANPTFGYDRIFNQYFYHSSEWRRARSGIILRDNGCDLGIDGYEIHNRIYIHHINPITLEDIEEESDRLFDPDNLVCVSFDTHNAIHFGTARTLPKNPVERVPGDTCPWR
jgi:hypothetical protein